MVYFFDSYFLMALPSTPALSKKLGRENFVLSCLVLSCLVLSCLVGCFSLPTDLFAVADCPMSRRDMGRLFMLVRITTRARILIAYKSLGGCRMRPRDSSHRSPLTAVITNRA